MVWRTVAGGKEMTIDCCRRSRSGEALYVRDIDAVQLTSLGENVEGALRRTDSLIRPAAFPQTPHDAGRFYPSHGQYLWWMDCNRWTVDRLTDAHLARGGRGVIFSGQVPARLIGFVRVR